MQQWYSLFPKSPWLSIYGWIIFGLLPFFFIFRSSSPIEISIGIILVALFYVCYRLSYRSKTGLVYMWISFEIIIHIVMTLLFGYVYLSVFIAFFIGNIRNPVGFYIVYGLHIALTIGAVVAGFFIDMSLFLPQIHFILVSIIGVVLLPFNLYNRHKREKLENQLQHARERIAELILLEERERIARDLHDILGQKLSLIGLKSDLANRLLTKDLAAAQKELADIRQTSSTALKEVRELVDDMRMVKLSDELLRVQHMLNAAEIAYTVEEDALFTDLPPLVENVLSMCLKEAVTNVVKHSEATRCSITFEQTEDLLSLQIADDGIGVKLAETHFKGNGLKGIQERLEFVNGRLQVRYEKGTIIIIQIPIILKQGGQME